MPAFTGHTTGHADLPHPALGQDVTPSPTTGRVQAVSAVRAGSGLAMIDHPSWAAALSLSSPFVSWATAPAPGRHAVIIPDGRELVGTGSAAFDAAHLNRLSGTVERRGDPESARLVVDPEVNVIRVALARRPWHRSGPPRKGIGRRRLPTGQKLGSVDAAGSRRPPSHSHRRIAGPATHAATMRPPSRPRHFLPSLWWCKPYAWYLVQGPSTPGAPLLERHWA